MIRAICLAGSVAGALALSQFPEFSQQYMQRLAGQVDELTRDIKQLDEMALDLRMGREARLEQMAVTPTFAADAAHWRSKIARHAVLGANLDTLRAATPMERMAMPHRFADTATMQAVWADFTPAVPVTKAGAASAGAGFLGGWIGLAGFFALLRAPFRRRRAPARPQNSKHSIRRDPVVARPTIRNEPAEFRPKLAGVQR